MEFHRAGEVGGHSQSQSTRSKESGGSYSHNNDGGERDTEENKWRRGVGVLKHDEMRCVYIYVCAVFALSEVAAGQDLFQLECFVFVC